MEERGTGEQLRLPNDRLAESQRIAHVGSWEWDVESNRVSWSEELYRIYGVDKSDFDNTYESFLARVLPDDREYTRSVIFEASRTRKAFCYDHRIVRPDGQVRMLHTRGDVFSTPEGRLVRLAGGCWDTTELWQANLETERTISLLHATLESTADGLVVVDRAGKVVAHNRRLLELWHLHDSLPASDFEVLIETVHDQIENPEACMRVVREMAAHPEAESHDVLHFDDGRIFARYSRPQRVGDDIVGRVWSYRDITERERLLRRVLFLSDASRLLASLDVEEALEAMAHLAIPFVGDSCAIDLCSDGKRRRLLAISRHPSFSISGEPPHAAPAGKTTLYQVGTSSYMTVPLLAHGELLGALTFGVHGTRSYGELDLALATELGQRVEAAIENARLYRRSQEALAARDEFLAIAAHEIRGPMTSLHLAAQSIGTAAPATLPRLVAIIELEGRRLVRFVNELLDVAQLRGGQLQLDNAQVNLAEVTRDVVNRLATELTRSGSTLSTTCPGSLVGCWDRGRLDQIVTNLLSNAIRFGRGGPIQIVLASDPNEATLTVRDHGIGIPVDAQKRIFEPFERAVPPRHYGGLGLGLYVVRAIVEAIGGSVGVVSRPNEGATFTVRLPLSDCP